jgi:16S rRNA (guanine(966)-N(2))-methyltransferase RsmD
LFNWLGQDLSGWRCIDAFAGTGALGLEAASRGASWVTLVECEAKLVAQLRTTVARLNATSVQVLHADAVKTLSAQPTASLDLVLLDPPFDSQLYIPALTAAAPTLRLGGWLYLEAPNAWSDSDCQALGLTLHRYLKAGAVHAHLLIKKE